MKTFEWGYKIIFAIILGVAIAVLALSLLSKKTGIHLFIVQSGSMSPTISTGSIVITKQAKSLTPGDIITFTSPNFSGTPVTHRIAQIQNTPEGQYIYTKGDANSSVDLGHIQQSAVIGKMLFHIPYLGYIIRAQQKPIGFFILIVIPCLILITDEVKNIVSTIKSRESI